MRATLLSIVCLVLAGCVTVPHQDYNKSANAEIKKIGLVLVPNPVAYTVNLVHHPRMQFGLIGGLVAAADISSKSQTFSQQQVGKHLVLGPEFTTALKEELEAAGYEVVSARISERSRRIQ